MDRFESDESGQIIVIAALLLAVLFVGLALVLNSAIYAENIATRGETSTSETVAQASDAEDRLQNSVYKANFENPDEKFATREGRIQDNISDWNQNRGELGATRGTVVSADLGPTIEGVRVTQDSKGNFMPAESTLLDEITVDVTGFLTSDEVEFRIDPLGLGDKKNWIIANDTNLRSFEMTVDRASLQESRGTLIDDIINLGDAILTGSNAFWVEFHEDEDTQWRVYLVNDTSNESVSVVMTKIEDGNEIHQKTCSAKGDEVTVKLSEGKLTGDDGEGTECKTLREISNRNFDEVYYVGADEVEGTYNFIGDKPEDQFREDLDDRYGLYLENEIDDLVEDTSDLFSFIDNLLEGLGLDDLAAGDLFHTDPNSDRGWTTTAVYDATVEVNYVDDRITYTKNVSIVSDS